MPLIEDTAMKSALDYEEIMVEENTLMYVKEALNACASKWNIPLSRQRAKETLSIIKQLEADKAELVEALTDCGPLDMGHYVEIDSEKWGEVENILVRQLIAKHGGQDEQ